MNAYWLVMHTEQAETGEIPSAGTSPPALMMAGKSRNKENKMKERISISGGEYIDFITRAIRGDNA